MLFINNQNRTTAGISAQGSSTHHKAEKTAKAHTQPVRKVAQSKESPPTYGSAALRQATSARARTGRESSDLICASWELWRNEVHVCITPKSLPTL